MTVAFPRDAARALLLKAIFEDAPLGDVTTRALGEAADGPVRASFVVKKPCTLAGLPVLELVGELTDGQITAELEASDGEAVLEIPREIGRWTGPASAVLLWERVTLNLLQHLCGVATATRACVMAVRATRRNSPTRILDTRKTLPGLRALDKYAVRCGGGLNHREGLSDALMIKDNHIALAGGVAEAVRPAVAAAAATGLTLVVEVTSLDQARAAVDAGATRLLLDNMGDGEMAEVRDVLPPPVVLEASGNMTVERLPKVGEIGLDFVSVGGLTHSAPAADISLEMHPSAVAAPRKVLVTAAASAGQLATLDLTRIRSALTTRRLGNVAVLTHTDSTNDEARRRLLAGADPPFVVLSEVQLKGRGRRGRTWAARPRTSILFSLAVTAPPPDQCGALALVAACSVAADLRRYWGIPASVEWPNDLVLPRPDGSWAKLGGMLGETCRVGDETVLILGMGINANLSGESLSREVGRPAATLMDALGTPVDRDLVFASFLNALEPDLDRFAKEGFAPFQARIMSLMAHAEGEQVRILQDQEEIRGACMGLAADGALLVQVEGRKAPVSVYWGEIAL